MSLELDPRCELPIPQQPEKESSQYEKGEADETCDYTSTASEQQHGPKISIIFLLSAALAATTVFAVVAAAVGGSIAVQRRHRINGLEKLLDDRCAENTSAILSGDNLTTASTCTPTSTPTAIRYDPIRDNILPSSNCSAMGSTYTSANTQSPFTVQCETDYPTSDFLGVWVFTFADCMEACSSYNAHVKSPRCYAVSYQANGKFTEEGGFGNCWLKGSGNVEARSKNSTDSGVFNFDSK